jgi:hypothetical protein
MENIENSNTVIAADKFSSWMNRKPELSSSTTANSKRFDSIGNTLSSYKKSWNKPVPAKPTARSTPDERMEFAQFHREIYLPSVLVKHVTAYEAKKKENNQKYIGFDEALKLNAEDEDSNVVVDNVLDNILAQKLDEYKEEDHPIKMTDKIREELDKQAAAATQRKVEYDARVSALYGAIKKYDTKRASEIEVRDGSMPYTSFEVNCAANKDESFFNDADKKDSDYEKIPTNYGYSDVGYT